MLIGKDTIVNVMIENHYRDRVQVVKDTIHKVDVVEVEKKINKLITQKYIFIYLALVLEFFVLIILVILWYISKNKT